MSGQPRMPKKTGTKNLVFLPRRLVYTLMSMGWGFWVTGLRLKGCGSDMLRMAVRKKLRIGVAEGILFPGGFFLKDRDRLDLGGVGDVDMGFCFGGIKFQSSDWMELSVEW